MLVQTQKWARSGFQVAKASREEVSSLQSENIRTSPERGRSNQSSSLHTHSIFPGILTDNTNLSVMRECIS